MRHGLTALLLSVLLAGCASVTQGTGSSEVPPTPGLTRTSLPGATTYPRNPVSSAIGDPATADLCAKIDLGRFRTLKYQASFANIVYPPGCSVVLKVTGEALITAYVYAPAPNTFSHLAPSDAARAKPISTQTIDGLTVHYYGYAPIPFGDCRYDVLADGITLRVSINSRAAPGKASRILDCVAAQELRDQVVSFVSKQDVPRLALASPSASSIDFCAALRAVKISDLVGFQNARIAPDGVGNGCGITQGDHFLFYLDLAVTEPAAPAGSNPLRTLHGHRIYVSQRNDNAKNCAFVATQGTTSDGRHEQVTAEVTSDRSIANLCDSTATVLTRFLDATGLA